jgi:carboxyl-terminal processing protease
MARQIADTIRKQYYDVAYHGMDLDARFKAADEKIQKAPNLGQAFGAIAEVLDGLNDSHTFFNPPSRPIQREPGYRWAMIGDACLITAVRPGTDATEKLSPGDQVLTLAGFRVNRANFWKIGYSVNRLYELPLVNMAIRRPDGSEAKVAVAAKIERSKRVLDLRQGDDIWQVILGAEKQDQLYRQRYVETGETAMIWKMPQFDLSDDQVNTIIRKARTHTALIIDLRGNPGGYEQTLQTLTGYLMDHDVKIATRTGRKPDLKPVLAKSRGSSVFGGKLVVLVDARSASAAELLARVVQLEKRGTVIGDRTSGHVMESLYYPLSHGAYTETLYGVSVTQADLIMADGMSLEHTGVTPDELLLPTAADLAAGRDPVLAKAAAIVGLALDPVAAAKLFPIEWQ